VRGQSGPEQSRCSDAGDVGGEEVHAVAVEVAAGAVVVLGGAGVGVAGQDLGVAKRHAASRALVIAAWRSECGLMCRGIAAAFAIRATIR
jgi:hypothetical protein